MAAPLERRDSTRDPSSGRARKPQLPIWQEMLLLLGIALVLAVVIKAFFVQAFYIPSASMEPLVKNDRILVQKVSYWSGRPHRGDIVVFTDPGGWLDTSESQPARAARSRRRWRRSVSIRPVATW